MHQIENTLLSEQGVIISDARFVAGSTTYPISGITTVSFYKGPSITPSQPFLAIVAIVLGVLGLYLYGLGLILLIPGVLHLKKPVPTFYVQIGTAGGQVNAIHSADLAFVQRVVACLNQAIIQRGASQQMYNPQIQQPQIHQIIERQVYVTSCQYCGHTMNFELQVCPNCGARKSN